MRLEKKRGLYLHKEHIPQIKQDNICTLDNCLVTEISSQGEKCFLTCVYCSASQNHDKFEDFCTKFYLLLRNINNGFPLCSIVTGDLTLDAQGGRKMTLLHEAWYYDKANVENIKKAVAEKVELLNETLLNIFWNYISNKKIKCDYCQPSWMTDNIRKSLKQRSKLTKIFYKNGQKNSDYIKVLEESEECTSLISEAKKNYILKMTCKLEDSNTASKIYWSILNRFLYNKKILVMQPLIVDGNFISDFCEKANLFNNFFSSISTPIKNNSRLPPSICKRNTRIHCFCVTNKDILSITNSLNSSKAHGYDNIYSTPKNYFCGIIDKRNFPDIRKKGNMIPAHKRGKTLINNYRPISLVPIFGKIFERVTLILFSTIF